jgi:hypothetical protein
MTFSIGPRGLGLLVALCTGLAHAAEAPTLEETAIKLDGIIESIKKQAVNFNQEAQDIERAALYPDRTRVSVYLSNNISQLLLHNVTITLNDGQPVRYDFGDRSARALLLSDGLHRTLLTNLEPGKHRIRAEIRGRFADDNKKEPTVSARFEGEFEKTRRPAELELRIARNSRLSKPQIGLVVWTPATAEERAEAESRAKSQKRRTPR